MNFDVVLLLAIAMNPLNFWYFMHICSVHTTNKFLYTLHIVRDVHKIHLKRRNESSQQRVEKKQSSSNVFVVFFSSSSSRLSLSLVAFKISFPNSIIQLSCAADLYTAKQLIKTEQTVKLLIKHWSMQIAIVAPFTFLFCRRTIKIPGDNLSSY